MSGERLLAVFERVLAAFASLKLAICVISSLAFFLAVATIYESVYGAPAAQAVVYGSPVFFTIMVLLALNVAAAVIVRYPFKRRQTGFVITHIGIELLLFGCLISYHRSAEGVVALRAGQTVDAIDSIREGVFVSWSDGGRVRQEALPLDCWQDAGFPSVGRFVGGAVKSLPDDVRWTGAPVTKFVAPGVKLELVDWLPAAKSERRAVDTPNGSPAVLVRLNGRTPNGMAQDERVWLHQDNSPGAAAALFGGTVEAVLWQGRTTADVDAFLHPPAAAELPAAGRVTVRVGDNSAAIDLSTQLGQAVPLGNGWRATVVEYFPEARWDGTKLSKAGDTPTDPMVRLRLDGPTGTGEWVAAARYPFLTGALSGALGSTLPAGETISVTYDHPTVLITDKNGQRGRLHLLQGPDGKLYARRFGLKGLMEPPAEVKPGEETNGFMGLRMSVVEHHNAAVVRDEFVPSRVAPAKMADAMRAARIVLTVDGERREAWLARGAGTTRLDTPRGPMSVAYGFDSIRLPFRMELKSASMSRDPGSSNAASYQSDVEIVSDDGTRAPHAITMNEPAEVAGMTFYQSGFDEASPGGTITVLRMRQDAGRWAKYGGCGLIVSGILIMFYMKAYFQKPATTSAKTAAARPGKFAAAVASVLLMLLLSGPALAAVKVDALANLPVLDNGRVKPLDTLARETIRFVTNRETLEAIDAKGATRKLPPLAALLDWHDNPVYWAEAPIVYVPHLELRARLKMAASAKFIAANVLAADKDFATWTADLHRRAVEAERTGEQARFTRLEEAATEVARRLDLFDAARDGRLTTLVRTADPEGRWASVADLKSNLHQIPPPFVAVGGAWQGVEAAYRGDDQAAFDASVVTLRSRIADAGGAYADQPRIDREVKYNGVKPFRIVWIAYFLTLAALVASLLVKRRWIYAGAMTLLVATIIGHCAAFAFRCSITGWAPVTNIYETVIWVALTAAVLSAVLEFIYRTRTIAIGGAATALITSVVADVMPPEYGHQLRNLTPVLRSNYWLVIHVLTIVSSYAAFALACVIGNIVLVQYMLKNRPAEAIRQNLNFIYRSVQVGVVLVAAGTILGGLWADVSWGRFWGWDPKEVWALIILLTYLALLHGRFAGWVGPFGMAAGSVLCFVTVLMSWYGVNFILGVGLHAYGFGAGGQGYMATYVAAQLVFVCVAKVVHARRGREKRETDSTASGPLSHVVMGEG